MIKNGEVHQIKCWIECSSVNFWDKLTQSFDSCCFLFIFFFFFNFSHKVHVYAFVQKHPIQNVSKSVKLKNFDLIRLQSITYNNVE